MSSEANKAIVRRAVEEVWSLQNPAAAFELYADAVRSEGQPLGGPQAVIDNFTRIHAARRDLRYTINELLADGDQVVLSWTGRYTPVGEIQHPLFGRLPTGQELTLHAVVIFHLADGKIVDSYQTVDDQSLGQQLGRVPSVGSTPVSEPDLEANKAVVRRLIEDVWNRANPDAVDEIIAPDRLFAGRPAPPQVVRTNGARTVAALPDIHWTINALVAEGDTVVLWYTGRGTHLGAYEHRVFGRVAPTGKPLTMNGLAIHRVVEGKLVELLVQIEDELNLGQQLGVIPTPTQAPALAEVNKAVVRRLVEEVWNRTNPAAADELIAADHPFGGPEAVRADVSRVATSRPDVHYTINTLTAEGDLVTLRWTSQGTLRAGFDHPVFGHVAPTGHALTETGINILHVVNGKVVEGWAIKDVVSVGRQLGLLPTPNQPSA